MIHIVLVLVANKQLYFHTLQLLFYIARYPMGALFWKVKAEAPSSSKPGALHSGAVQAAPVIDWVVDWKARWSSERGDESSTAWTAARHS